MIPTDGAGDDGTANGYDYESVQMSKNCDGEFLIELNKFVGTLRIKDHGIDGAPSSEHSCLDVTEDADKKRAATASDNEPAAKRTKQNHNNHSGDEEDVGLDDGSAIIRTPQRLSRLEARLSERPKTLHELWVEYQFGSNGRKAAKDFTQVERGAAKSLYCNRKRFWSKCADMIKDGMSVDVAIDTIYRAYAPATSITVICKKMGIDKKEGWPTLSPLLQKEAPEEEGSPGESNVTKPTPVEKVSPGGNKVTKPKPRPPPKGPFAALSENPSTLNDLWIEYRFGISGRKAAKDFTRAEKEEFKSQYCARRHFWLKCAEMIGCGMTPDAAIDAIYRAYGRRTSITNILKQIKIDRKEGWPRLSEKNPSLHTPKTGLKSELSNRPKTLQELWKEYDFGLDGNKAAKKFDAQERGAVKHLYCFRLPFWTKCAEMIRCGMTEEEAIDTIYQAYGVSSSVTMILKKMRIDKRDCSWPYALQPPNAGITWRQSEGANKEEST